MVEAGGGGGGDFPIMVVMIVVRRGGGGVEDDDDHDVMMVVVVMVVVVMQLILHFWKPRENWSVSVVVNSPFGYPASRISYLENVPKGKRLCWQGTFWEYLCKFPEANFTVGKSAKHRSWLPFHTNQLPTDKGSNVFPADGVRNNVLHGSMREWSINFLFISTTSVITHVRTRCISWCSISRTKFFDSRPQTTPLDNTTPKSGSICENVSFSGPVTINPNPSWCVFLHEMVLDKAKSFRREVLWNVSMGCFRHSAIVNFESGKGFPCNAERTAAPHQYTRKILNICVPFLMKRGNGKNANAFKRLLNAFKRFPNAFERVLVFPYSTFHQEDQT